MKACDTLTKSRNKLQQNHETNSNKIMKQTLTNNDEITQQNVTTRRTSPNEIVKQIRRLNKFQRNCYVESPNYIGEFRIGSESATV